jgi:hypothetical protein
MVARQRGDAEAGAAQRRQVRRIAGRSGNVAFQLSTSMRVRHLDVADREVGCAQ